MKPRLLDLFCCAGGAGMGYHRAGFEVVGVDIEPQPRYPFEFHQADALEYLAAHGHEFDAIHASPPCQGYSALNTMWNSREHPKLIGQVRELLIKTGKPYVIENVEGAKKELISPLMLCGSFFGLESNGYQLRRHRLFESNVFLMRGNLCYHAEKTVGVYGAKARDIALEKRHYSQDKETRGAPVGVVLPKEVGFEAMGIDWMTQDELSEAIPPAYTEYIGKQLLQVLQPQAGD
jgi:DNA (cytosine-5)-methyltransferase 1